MKTRNFIAKAISSIVNLDRYPNLIYEILNDHLNVDLVNNQQNSINHNKIHGLVDVLNNLLDKYDILKFIKFQEFLGYLDQLINLKL